MNSKIKNAFLLLLHIIICNIAFSQTAEEESLYKKADSYFRKDVYDSAAYCFEKLIVLDKQNFDYVFSAGISYYLSGKRSKAKAIPFFEKMVKYNKFNDYPELYYYLGKCYHVIGEYDKATSYYNKFMKFIEMGKTGKTLRVEVNDLLRRCFIGIALKADSLNVNVSNAGDVVNSNVDDYNPVILNNKKNMVYLSKKIKENNNKNNYSYYYYYNPEKDIYVVVRSEKEKWEDPQSIGNIIFINPSTIKVKDELLYFKEDEYSDLSVINKENDTVYLSMNREDSFGERDIYMAIRQQNGNLINYKNLGLEINTKFNEITPFYDYKKRTLYFSSNNDNSLGGYDIFYTRKIKGQWMPPKNIGYPINSPGDDINYMILSDSKNAYYASSKESGFGGFDIYHIEYIQNELNKNMIISNPEIKSDSVANKIAEKTNKKETVEKPVEKPKITQEYIKTSKTKNIEFFNNREELKTYFVNNQQSVTHSDTIHLVQIGAYRKEISVNYFGGFDKVIGLLFEDKIYRYYVLPKENKKQAALSLRENAVLLGYKDSFITFIIF